VGGVGATTQTARQAAFRATDAKSTVHVVHNDHNSAPHMLVRGMMFTRFGPMVCTVVAEASQGEVVAAGAVEDWRSTTQTI